jgi:hypothetical protein
VAQVITIVTDGYTSEAHETLPSGKPGRKIVKKELATFFSKSRELAQEETHRFAILTSIRTHPGSYQFTSGTSLPTLGLGAIVQHPDGTYLLCLQATCDSVRLKDKTAFLFIPMVQTNGDPHHVAPLHQSGKSTSVGLAISKNSYSLARSIEFQPSTAKTVIGARDSKKKIQFKSTDGLNYQWIASLKQRRALRVAQRLGQSMGRLGFDEFEPFRKESEE